MSVDLVFRDGSVLQKVVKAVKELVTDATVMITEENGLKWEEMDSSHVSLISVQFMPTAFSTAKVSKPKSLGVNLASLEKILSCIKAQDLLQLKMSDTDSDQLQITATSVKTKGKSSDKLDKSKVRVANFALKLIHIDGEKLEIPDTEYSAHIIMKSDEFRRMVNDAIKLGDNMKIMIRESDVSFSVIGGSSDGCFTYPNSKPPTLPSVPSVPSVPSKPSIDDFEADLVDDSDPEKTYIYFDGKHGAEIVSTFSIKFLASFTKCTNISPYVHISISPDVPMVVRYPFLSSPIETTTTTTTEKEDDKEEHPDKKKEKSEPTTTAANNTLSSWKKKGASKRSAVATDSEDAPTNKKRKMNQQIGSVTYYLAPKTDDDAPTQAEPTHEDAPTDDT
jgi:proliferating cell nuclear antigen